MSKQSEHLANLKRINDERYALVRSVAHKWQTETPAVPGPLDNMQWELGSSWTYFNGELQDNTNDFLANPAHYFEWAEGRMIAAASREILDSIILRVEKGADLLTVVREMQEDLTMRLLKNYDAGTSSSAASNAQATYRRTARAQMLEKLTNLIKWTEKNI